MSEGVLNTIKLIKKVCDIMTLIFVISMIAGLVLYYCNVKGLLYGLAGSLFLLSMIAILIDLMPLLKKTKIVQDALTSQNELSRLDGEINLDFLKKHQHIKYYSILAIACFIALLWAVYSKEAFMIGAMCGMLVGTFLLTIMYLLLNYLAEILSHEIARKANN